MKYLLSLSLSLLLFVSCEQCYKCELKDNNGNIDDTVEFCGTTEQANEYEAANYTCSNQ